jgi:hypothetical protein
MIRDFGTVAPVPRGSSRRTARSGDLTGPLRISPGTPAGPRVREAATGCVPAASRGARRHESPHVRRRVRRPEAARLASRDRPRAVTAWHGSPRTAAAVAVTRLERGNAANTRSGRVSERLCPVLTGWRGVVAQEARAGTSGSAGPALRPPLRARRARSMACRFPKPVRSCGNRSADHFTRNTRRDRPGWGEDLPPHHRCGDRDRRAGIRVPALVDSGADNTLVPKSCVAPLGVDFSKLAACSPGA